MLGQAGVLPKCGNERCGWCSKASASVLSGLMSKALQKALPYARSGRRRCWRMVQRRLGVPRGGVVVELQSVGGEAEAGWARPPIPLSPYARSGRRRCRRMMQRRLGVPHGGTDVGLQCVSGEREEGRPQGTSLFCYTPDRTCEPGPSCGTASEFADANSDSFRRPDAKQERVPRHPLLLYALLDNFRTPGD